MRDNKNWFYTPLKDWDKPISNDIDDGSSSFNNIDNNIQIQNEKIKLLRNMNSIIIPSLFTYFHHSTSYIPQELKERSVRGKYMRNWTSLPKEEFTILNEMSFVERDDRIRETLDYNKPLTSTPIMYTIDDYSKPFCIRILMPKLESVMNDALPINEDYKNEYFQLYYGYGDGRHPKLKDGEKIIIIGNSLKDEVSGKVVDIFYGIREIDLDMYYNEVIKTIKNGYTEDLSVNLLTKDEFGRYTNFYPQSYSIPKDSNPNRYIGAHSEFEEELYEDYKDVIEENITQLPALNIKDTLYYRKLYDNYSETKKNTKQF